MHRIAHIVGHLPALSSSITPTTPAATSSSTSLASLVDHTLLAASSTQTQIEQLCDEAIKYSFASVCVNPSWVSLCANKLAKSNVKVCTVIGFPLGANSSIIKSIEADQAVRDGATEVDMVINVGRLKTGDTEYVYHDIASVVTAARHAAASIPNHGGVIVKVIIETALLTNDEKITACSLAVRAGADFVKTSTGFAASGAKVDDVVLMRRTVGPTIGVKASGSIRDRATAVAMVNAGATRLGTSSGVVIASNTPTPTSSLKGSY